MILDAGIMFAAGNAGAPYGKVESIAKVREMPPKVEQKSIERKQSISSGYTVTKTGDAVIPHSVGAATAGFQKNMDINK